MTTSFRGGLIVYIDLIATPEVLHLMTTFFGGGLIVYIDLIATPEVLHLKDYLLRRWPDSLYCLDRNYR